MNKLITLILIVLTTSTYAQKGLNLGISGNLNTVWIVNQNAYGAEEYDYKLKTGSGAGIDVGYNLTNHLGIFTGFKFSNQGQKYESSKHTGETRDISLKYNYVPLLFRFTGGSSKVKFYVQAGPQFGFLSDAKYTYKNPNVPVEFSMAFKDRFTKSDNGINFGLGANIDIITNLYVSAGLDFFYSFRDINDDKFHIPDHSGVYQASKNALGGLRIGVSYILFGED